MQREHDSHKGENGKIAVIGGSRTMHGAPLLSALAAEAAGVDLIHVFLPDWHENVAKETSLNFQVHPLEGDSLHAEHVPQIIDFLATTDCAVIGPGIAKTEESIRAIETLIAEATCPLVIDATALQPQTLSWIKTPGCVLTPHLGELERMKIEPRNIAKAAKAHKATILLKSSVDVIAGPQGQMEEVSGGNAGLTVGGTGDTLAGLICGLIAQHMDAFDAAVTAARIVKRAGTVLYQDKGYAYNARDVIAQIPMLLHALGQ